VDVRVGFMIDKVEQVILVSEVECVRKDEKRYKGVDTSKIRIVGVHVLNSGVRGQAQWGPFLRLRLC